MNRAYDPRDGYEDDDAELDLAPHLLRRQQRDRVKPKARSHSRDDLAELAAVEQGLKISYQPARYEAVWLQSSLLPFFSEDLIVDVLAQVKGGKEASVYRCRAHPVTGLELVAAKVYRPRMFRNLRNDKQYRDGRPVLTVDGRAVKQTDDRLMRAIGKKTEFGAQVLHTSWLMYEYTTLERLFQAGAAVPRPLASAENAILMSYHGDELRAAPTLSEIQLPRREAAAIFDEILRSVELMLQHGLVHGDLSAYNILYWEGKITLIDFPQVVNLHSNEHAREILWRDITRVCEHFSRQGLQRDPEALAEELWSRYGPPEQLPQIHDQEV